MRLEGVVNKGWGQELIFVTNDYYCGKILAFNTGSQFSTHFHREKMESWFVLDGKFKLEIIDTKDASISTFELSSGDVWTNEPLVPHRLICIEAGSIIEVSTPDSVEDNYRVLKGDSQTTSSSQ